LSVNSANACSVNPAASTAGTQCYFSPVCSARADTYADCITATGTDNVNVDCCLLPEVLIPKGGDDCDSKYGPSGSVGSWYTTAECDIAEDAADANTCTDITGNGYVGLDNDACDDVVKTRTTITVGSGVTKTISNSNAGTSSATASVITNTDDDYPGGCSVFHNSGDGGTFVTVYWKDPSGAVYQTGATAERAMCSAGGNWYIQCLCDLAPNVDCAGTWACSAACIREFTETAAQSGTGSTCPVDPDPTNCQPSVGSCSATATCVVNTVANAATGTCPTAACSSRAATNAACIAPYADGDSVDCCAFKVPSPCLINQYVSSGTCTACAAGSTNAAGDNANGGVDTSCDPTLCAEDFYVSNNVCTACASGETKPAGDDATGANTVCSIIVDVLIPKGGDDCEQRYGPTGGNNYYTTAECDIAEDAAAANTCTDITGNGYLALSQVECDNVVKTTSSFSTIGVTKTIGNANAGFSAATAVVIANTDDDYPGGCSVFHNSADGGTFVTVYWKDPSGAVYQTGATAERATCSAGGNWYIQCLCETAPGVDCAGTWACSAACIRAFTTTTAQSGTGAACPADPDPTNCQPSVGSCSASATCVVNSAANAATGTCPTAACSSRAATNAACIAPYADGDSVDCCAFTVPSLCAINQYVSSGTCTACAAGSTNDAGDNANGNVDTSCDPTLCAEDFYVSNNACVACASGETKPAGDDASGANTICSIVDDVLIPKGGDDCESRYGPTGGNNYYTTAECDIAEDAGSANTCAGITGSGYTGLTQVECDNVVRTRTSFSTIGVTKTIGNANAGTPSGTASVITWDENPGGCHIFHNSGDGGTGVTVYWKDPSGASYTTGNNRATCSADGNWYMQCLCEAAVALKCNTHTCTVAGNLLMYLASQKDCSLAGCDDGTCCYRPPVYLPGGTCDTAVADSAACADLASKISGITSAADVSEANSPKGCFVGADGVVFKWNTHGTGSACGLNSKECVCADSPTDEPHFHPFSPCETEVASETECNTLGTALAGYSYGMGVNWGNNQPKGCFVNNNVFYYNLAASSTYVCDVTAHCVCLAQAAACAVNEYVASGACVTCPGSSTNDAGDLIAGGNTYCACPANTNVASNTCAACAAGSTNAANDVVPGTDTSCDVTACATDEHVNGANACVACPAGSTNVAGDLATGDATTCDATLCAVDKHVVSNVCQNCPTSSTNVANDDATGSDTPCNCIVNTHVSGNTCAACATDYTNVAGDAVYPGANTACDLDVDCVGTFNPATCQADCGALTFTQTTAQAGIGDSCATVYGEVGLVHQGTVDCTNGEGACVTVHCVGAFGDCDVDCVKTYSITTAALAGGTACAQVHGYTEACTTVQGSCIQCVLNKVELQANNYQSCYP